MKKLYYLIFVLSLVILSCNKPPEISQTQDVIFTATTNSTGLKSSCDNPPANFALIKIDGIIHQVDVFNLNGRLYTNTLKLLPGNHVVSEFALINDEDPSGDIIVQAIPLAGTEYAKFVNKPLPFTFTVTAFLKSEISIEVLCYEPAEHENFGFAWFSVDEITIREFCFFGDICIDDYMSYAGSLYENQQNGLVHDMPAIFKIDVIRNDHFLISYTNEAWLGEGAPLCVQYPDYTNLTDRYKFILYILVNDGGQFVYNQFYIWETTDNGSLPNIGTDNVLDFVLGDCVPDADLILPPFGDPPPDPDPVISYHNICFIGDLCADDFVDYTGSLYDNANGLDQNMPAIFKIDFDHNGTVTTYDNEALVGSDSPLCFIYPNYPDVVDNYEFTLSILVIDGNQFVYKEFYTWTATDDEPLANIGIDNTMEFVLGDCTIGELNIPPYTNPNPPTPDPDPSYSCETAFAYDSSLSSCFIDDGFGNWGWTNGTYSVGEYTLDLVAAAGGCDLSNGQVVGSVLLDYRSNGVVKVTYSVDAGFEMEAVHLYIGYDSYPEKGDDPTVAPGQYTIIDDELTVDEASEYKFNLNGYSGPIYMIAHADVCGNFSTK